jgi:hypothetical protein
MTVTTEPERPAGCDVDGRIVLLDDRRADDLDRTSDRVTPPCANVLPLAIHVDAAVVTCCGTTKGQGLSSGNLRARHSADGNKPQGNEFDRVFGIGVRKPLGVLGVETQANFVDATFVDRNLAPGHGEFEGLSAIAQIGRQLELLIVWGNAVSFEPPPSDSQYMNLPTQPRYYQTAALPNG